MPLFADAAALLVFATVTTKEIPLDLANIPAYGLNASAVTAEPDVAVAVPVPAIIAVAAGLVAMSGVVFNMVYWQRRQRAAHCDRNGGLWVIAGSVYDLKRHSFMDRHPGGRYILEATQGRDCSAMFHSYHATTSKPIATMLEKFFVREAKPEECVDSKIWDFNDMPFYTELQTEVQKAMGRERRNVKASGAHLAQYLVCSTLMLTSLRGWLLGSTVAGVVFGLMIWFCSGDILHASTHYAVFENAEMNLLTGWLFGWLHHVPSMWVRQHVLGHHAYTNVPGLDPDLDHFRQFSKARGGWRLTDTQKPRGSYLNWRYSMGPIMAITGIGPLIGESIQALITGHYMRHIPLKFVRGEYALTVLQLTLAIFMGIVLPYYMSGSTPHVLLPYSIHGLLYYLVAFGPSRHRAWIEGQSPQGCFLGSLRRASRGLLGPVLRPLSWLLGPPGGLLGASWGLLGPSWGLLGASWEPPEGLLGASWGPLGASWGHLGASWGPLGAESWIFQFVVALLGRFCGRLGAFLGRLGGLLGRFGALLGRLWAVLGASWAVLGQYWRPLGPFWAVGSMNRRGREHLITIPPDP